MEDLKTNKNLIYAAVKGLSIVLGHEKDGASNSAYKTSSGHMSLINSAKGTFSQCRPTAPTFPLCILVGRSV